MEFRPLILTTLQMKELCSLIFMDNKALQEDGSIDYRGIAHRTGLTKLVCLAQSLGLSADDPSGR